MHHASIRPSSTTPRAAPTPISTAAAFVMAMTGVGIASHLGFGVEAPNQPDDVAVYLGAIACAVIACWWLANVAAWAAILRRGGTIERFTLPGSKRIAQFLIVAALSTSCVTSDADDPVMVLVSQETPLAADETTTSTTTPARPTTIPPTTALEDAPTPDAARDGDAPQPSPEAPVPNMPIERPPEPHADGRAAVSEHQRIVAAGDNLWSIAADTLATHGLPQPTCAQIADYWSQVVAANRVRSGNPDLIVVGETITLPSYEIAP